MPAAAVPTALPAAETTMTIEAQIAELNNRIDQAVVADVMGKPVTRAELSAALDRVADQTDWKAPINVVVVINSDFEMVLIREAVWFFTGSRATFTAKGRNQYQVKAAGYYTAIGA